MNAFFNLVYQFQFVVVKLKPKQIQVLNLIIQFIINYFYSLKFIILNH